MNALQCVRCSQAWGHDGGIVTTREGDAFRTHQLCPACYQVVTRRGYNEEKGWDFS